MNLAHHVLAQVTPAQVNQQNRQIYTFTFVAGCAWLFLLFISQGFRDWHKWVPGGLKLVLVLNLLVIGTSAYLLH